MKFVIAPDSFKGTIDSAEICDIVEQSIHKSMPAATVIKMPIADGGEGMVDAYLKSSGGQKVDVKVTGPNATREHAFYGILPDKKTAVIEMAAASGIMLASEPKQPMDATTYGTGQLIMDAVEKGCGKIVLGIGGSATMDGGVGMAGAMGVLFLDEDGRELPLTPNGLRRLHTIDTTRVSESLRGVKFLIASDVQNVLCGEMGAAHVFGRQKGADEAQIVEADGILKRLAGVIRDQTGDDLSQIKGTGAAGGLALPLLAFFDAKIVSGIDLMLDTVGFEQKIKDADMVITGEGMLDGQSMEGKVVIGIARRAKACGVPVVALVGDIGRHYERAYEQGVSAIFSTNKAAVPFEIARLTSREDLALLADSLFAFAAALGNGGTKGSA
ncbi:MAG: glycerate kinase [Christensenella sp.]|uniref:glycerate kinase n=1 Tax=Christensenella sp. TaxID=1935934 RepID=UPI002B217D12|nr:glycerate kinase [Christensenella sp.]MEA5003294.1 glycerate kinase [Christensenella sp.]